MTPKKAEQLLDKFACGLAKSIGFSRIDSDFYGYLVHDATAMMSFPRRFSAQGICLFTARIGLRFESLEKWLDFDNEGRPTLAQPIHFLREDKTYTEWEFSNADDLEKLWNRILDDLKKHAIPYIERYSRLVDLRKALESLNKQDWFNTGLNVDSRVTTLAAILFVEGDKIGAIKLLDDGVKTLEKSLADKPYELRKREFRKRSFDMEYLRKRLIEGC